MYCVGCGKKGVRWPHYEPIACTMCCLATQWMILSEAGGQIDGEHCSWCGDQLSGFGSDHWCKEQEEE